MVHIDDLICEDYRIHLKLKKDRLEIDIYSENTEELKELVNKTNLKIRKNRVKQKYIVFR